MRPDQIVLCMVVKDEATLVAPLLLAVEPYVGECVVVDTGSTDNTVIVASVRADIVCYYPLTGDFAAARNYGQSLSLSPWILVLDADEWPTKELLDWIATFEPVGDVRGVMFKRENRIDGTLLGDDRAYEWHVRLYRRDQGWAGSLHERAATDPAYTIKAPDTALLLHHKSAARQAAQDARYAAIAVDKAVRLNIGSGGRPIQGWVNIDAMKLPGVDLVRDARLGLPYDDLSVDAIWSSHMLEHVSYHEAGQVIGDWCRVLKIGGTIAVGTPDLRALCRGFMSGELEYLRTVQLMYGGHTSVFDYHNALFDEDWLRGQLEWWGCVDVKLLPDVRWSITVQATKVRHVPVEKLG